LQGTGLLSLKSIARAVCSAKSLKKLKYMQIQLLYYKQLRKEKKERKRLEKEQSRLANKLLLENGIKSGGLYENNQKYIKKLEETKEQGNNLTEQYIKTLKE
jgi:hypothetical protein